MSFYNLYIKIDTYYIDRLASPGEGRPNELAIETDLQFATSTMYTWTDNTDKNLKPNKAKMTAFKNLKL